MKPIGEILIEQGLITKDQLQKALEDQKHSSGKRRLGEMLIDMGVITEADIVVALCMQFNFAYLPLKIVSLNPEIYSLVPAALARRHSFIPIDKVGDLLTIVTSDPTDHEVVGEIQRITKCHVQIVISTISEVEDAISKCFAENQERQNQMPKKIKG